VVRETVLWRRKKLSLFQLVIATATWVVMEVYQFNFLTIASWAAMAIVTASFLWGNILRLVGKEPSDMSRLEIPEETAVRFAHRVKRSIEGGERWLFHVTIEREWYVFIGIVGVLYLLSILGSYSDFLTLLYIGNVLGMTVPVIYVKYENQIKRFGEGIRMRMRSVYERFDEKVIQRIKHKLFNHHEVKKEKKAE
ncbi:Reticulon, partial [Dillenia turbinata]